LIVTGIEVLSIVHVSRFTATTIVGAVKSSVVVPHRRAGERSTPVLVKIGTQPKSIYVLRPHLHKEVIDRSSNIEYGRVHPVRSDNAGRGDGRDVVHPSAQEVDQVV